MAQYSIKEVETLSGVKAHTLRIWEQRYDFLKPHRTDTNIRYYTDEQLKLLLNIGTLNRNGFKISRIAEMNSTDLANEVLKIYEQTSVPDNYMDSLVQSMIDFDEARFEKVLSSAIMRMGFEQTFTKVIFPFMIRTGVLWSTGAVKVVQEHFITNLIYRKICVAIDNQFVELSDKSKRFLLFLPESETHEMLLRFTEYILRKNNHHATYLGSAIPSEEIGFMIEKYRPDYLFTYLTLPFSDQSIESYLNSLATSFPDIKIIVGGAQVQLLASTSLSPCVKLVTSADELLAVIAKL